MPSQMHSEYDSQGQKIEAARQYARWLLSHKENILVATLIREVVKREPPGITTANQNKYSAHSLHVWACVFLDEARKSPNYIRKRLRWMSDSFCMYLCDTRVIQDMHSEAFQSSLQEIIDLLEAQPEDVRRRSTLSNVTPDDNMGKYHDKMD
jgi:hypothetical protein